MKTKNIRVPLRDGVMGAHLALPGRTPAGAIVAIMEDTARYLEAIPECNVSRLLKNSRRSRGGGSPENRPQTESMAYWIPAFAGMTFWPCAESFSTTC
jgi:hypothetical protein